MKIERISRELKEFTYINWACKTLQKILFGALGKSSKQEEYRLNPHSPHRTVFPLSISIYCLLLEAILKLRRRPLLSWLLSSYFLLKLTLSSFELSRKIFLLVTATVIANCSKHRALFLANVIHYSFF